MKRSLEYMKTTHVTATTYSDVKVFNVLAARRLIIFFLVQAPYKYFDANFISFASITVALACSQLLQQSLL